MRRPPLALLLLLVTAPLLCRAADSDTEPKRGACVYARPAATGSQAAGNDAPQARPATPPVARSAPRSGGGGGDAAADAPAPPTARPRARWHSFLPGMFR